MSGICWDGMNTVHLNSPQIRPRTYFVTNWPWLDLTLAGADRDINQTWRYCKTLPRVHIISCQGVKLFLPKDFFLVLKLSFIRIGVLTEFDFEVCHSLSFRVLLQIEFFEFFLLLLFWCLSFVAFLVLWQFKILRLVRIIFFEFCCYLSLKFFHIFFVFGFSQLDFRIFVTIWVLGYCHT